jgi:hypothetical protein
MSHRTPRERKSTPLVNQSQSASDSAFNMALTAVPSRLVVIFREVRYDSPIENKCPSVDTEEIMYQHLAPVIHKVYGTCSYDPSTVSGKDYFWTSEQASEDLCPLFGVWHGLRFNIFFAFFRCVVAAATMLCSPTHSRL